MRRRLEVLCLLVGLALGGPAVAADPPAPSATPSAFSDPGTAGPGAESAGLHASAALVAAEALASPPGPRLPPFPRAPSLRRSGEVRHYATPLAPPAVAHAARPEDVRARDALLRAGVLRWSTAAPPPVAPV